MEIRRRPVRGQYVVLITGESRTISRLGNAEQFSVEPIVELPGAYIARARDPDASEDDLRGKLRELIGVDCSIQNVIEDDEGHVFVPTGKINVKTSEALDKSELNSWIERHHLKLVNQSKWMPEVVTVTLEDCESDIDQVLRDLVLDSSVDFAEPDVLTKFARETGSKVD